MKTLEQRIELLKQAGVDVSKYELKLGNIVLKNDEVTNIVEDKQIENKAFRRWITAQTFAMLNYEKRSVYYNRNLDRYDCFVSARGWDECLKNKYHYMYQFKMMLEELKVLSKLEVKDKEEFRERSQFFTKEVVIDTCLHYLDQLYTYIYTNMNASGVVVLSRYGKVTIEKARELFINDLIDLTNEMFEVESYADLHCLLKIFIKKLNKLPADTPKCSSWKDAFKGSGAYYSLKNMILYHDVKFYVTCDYDGNNIRGSVNCYHDKHDALNVLTKYASKLEGNQKWRLHQALKETIRLNNFDLATSIEQHK